MNASEMKKLILCFQHQHQITLALYHVVVELTFPVDEIGLSRPLHWSFVLELFPI